MNILVLRKFRIIAIITASLLLSGCSFGSPAQKQFGVDSEYFAGLKLLEANKENEARSKLEKCAKKGSYYCARKSADVLTTIGSLQEKNKAVLNLYKKYPDSDSLLLASRYFTSTKDFSRVVELTHYVDLTSENNEIIKLRLEAMKKLKSANYDSSVFTWFTSRPISDFHYKFWRDNLYQTYANFENLDEDSLNQYNPQHFSINFRINVYKRDYTYCLRCAPKILDYFEQGTLPPNSQLASDLGKAYLYGSPNFYKNGMRFKTLAQKYENTNCEYYFWFYAARYFDKAVNYQSMAKKCFESAIDSAQTPEQKDNALWYYLNTQLNFSVNSIVDTIGSNAKHWSDAEYFEDFFNSLSAALMAGGRWDAFYKIYKQIENYASDETIAAFAYMYGRLLQENLTQAPEGISKEDEIKNAFTRACKSGSSSYYKILAAYQLDLDATEIEKLLCKQNANKCKGEIDKAAETLLKGYVVFGYPEYLYPAYMDLYKKGISTDTSLFIADFLRKCGNQENDYYTQSLRIAARTSSYGDRDFTKNELKLLYPNNYKDYVEESCKKYDMSDSVIYALIRSESFFDADITSSAGAIGLTQIMEFTGADIAQRLRKKEYSLTDAETNIDFGVYYLNNLYRRCDNNYLQAFAAYNAGLTKVRRWLQGSMVDLGKKKNLSTDIFLETIPIAETREYGQKLISASVMYEWLYNTEDPSKLAFMNMTEKLIK